MSAEMDPKLFGADDLTVRIMDLSGANGSDPVEEVRGFLTIEHANAFARRYVRDSVELCRSPEVPGRKVLELWFLYGEDAQVVDAGDAGWQSGTELSDFADRPASDEERDWRALDPRLDGGDEGGDEE